LPSHCSILCVLADSEFVADEEEKGVQYGEPEPGLREFEQELPEDLNDLSQVSNTIPRSLFTNCIKLYILELFYCLLYLKPVWIVSVSEMANIHLLEVYVACRDRIWSNT
jgi:hypothetical protein